MKYRMNHQIKSGTKLKVLLYFKIKNIFDTVILSYYFFIALFTINLKQFEQHSIIESSSNIKTSINSRDSIPHSFTRIRTFSYKNSIKEANERILLRFVTRNTHLIELIRPFIISRNETQLV